MSVRSLADSTQRRGQGSGGVCRSVQPCCSSCLTVGASGEIAKCKLQNANFQFAFCNLHFAICYATASHFLLCTNLFGVPSSGLPGSGRQRTTSSILRAKAKSLSVMPPAECVFNFTQSLPQVMAKSA